MEVNKEGAAGYGTVRSEGAAGDPIRFSGAGGSDPSRLSGVATYELQEELKRRGQYKPDVSDLPSNELIAETRKRGHTEFVVKSAKSADMLAVLQERGGHPGALAKAALLCIRKSQDYNSTQSDVDPHKVDRSAYFPLGVASYAQMLHTKAQRFLALTQNQMEGRDANFEGLKDTALDIINYAGFYVAFSEEKRE